MPSEIIWDHADAEVKPMVDELVEKYSEDLIHIIPERIGYLTFSKQKSKKQAYIGPVKPMYAMYMKLDYIMCIHLENWMGLTTGEKKVLLFHELLHIPEGGFDRESKEYRKTEDHDVKDFSLIIQKFGLNWEMSSKTLSEKDKAAAAEIAVKQDEEDEA